jgi:L-idonate 5-dehydrogenase
MKAFLLHAAHDVRATDLPRPVAGPGEIVLAMRRAGICGSDIHYYPHCRVGNFVPKHPFVLGHEFAGEIVEVGAGVPATRIGERVTIDPSMPCGHCEFCRAGRYNLCLYMRFYGSASCDPHINGGFEEFILAPAANTFVVPDALGWGEAAMTEPLSVAVHAAKRAGNLAGRSVLVTGGGTIGQLTARVARVFGAGIVVLSDILPGPR